MILNWNILALIYLKLICMKVISKTIFVLVTGVLSLALFYQFAARIVTYSPTDLSVNKLSVGSEAQVWGEVVRGSLRFYPKTDEYTFQVNDKKNTITVKFSGSLPEDFHEGYSAIIHGKLDKDHIFIASSLGLPK